MGKYLKKAKMAGDAAVMDVSQPPLGVRTRARTHAARHNGSSSPAFVGSSAVEDGLEWGDGRERSVRETTPSNLVTGSEALATTGSTNRPTSSAVTIAQTLSASPRSIPTTHEMEEFFAGAERQQMIIFTEKYNYDPVKDLPLPGRYEWVRLN